MREKDNILITSLVMLVVVVLIVAGFFVGENKPIKQYHDDTIASISPTPSVTLTPTPLLPRLPSKKGSSIFSSNNLGIAFYYAEKVGNNLVKTIEMNNQVYIYVDDGNTSPTAGQSIEVYSKDPNDSLKDAIKKALLTNIPDSKCFVEVKNTNKDKLIHAEIKYPVPTGGTGNDIPFYEYGQECPLDYKRTNGIRYFAMDPKHPKSFVFVNVGQYSLPSQTGSRIPWQETLIFFSK